MYQNDKKAWHVMRIKNFTNIPLLLLLLLLLYQTWFVYKCRHVNHEKWINCQKLTLTDNNYQIRIFICTFILSLLCNTHYKILLTYFIFFSLLLFFSIYRIVVVVGKENNLLLYLNIWVCSKQYVYVIFIMF